ncbi:hypothetical protein GCM10023192_64060 [Amycolatopsis samaneae]
MTRVPRVLTKIGIPDDYPENPGFKRAVTGTYPGELAYPDGELAYPDGRLACLDGRLVLCGRWEWVYL